MAYIGKVPSPVPMDASDIPANSIDNTKIIDGAITIADIADDAVTADKLANTINTAIAANTAKVTNATHTGDVTGSGALTIAADAITGAKIADDAVESEHIAAGAVDDAHIVDLTASKLTGTVADARIATLTSSKLSGALPAIDGSNLTGITTDTTVLENNIAMLGFFRAADNSKAKYNLVDQIIDEYQDATGIDTSASTGENLAGSGSLKYYSGVAAATGDTITTTYSYDGADDTIALSNGDIINRRANLRIQQ